jgi:predicted transglutaminase-like cysteine proteinase
VQERWTYPVQSKGDCEDIALLKRRMLIRAGIPVQSLLMTVVRDETGSGHAILTVVTDRGDFILDSKTNRILPWRATGYGFVKRQSQGNPTVWVKLGEPASPGLTVAGQ